MFYQQIVLDLPALIELFSGDTACYLEKKRIELKTFLVKLRAAPYFYSVNTSSHELHHFPESILIGFVPESDQEKWLTERLVHWLSLLDLPYRKGCTYR